MISRTCMRTSFMLVSILSFAVGITPVLGQGTTAASGQASTAKAELGYVATMKKDLRTMATAEEAYFVDHATYYSGPVSAASPLYGFSPSPGITINVSAAGGAAMWTAVATHARTPTKCTYKLPA